MKQINERNQTEIQYVATFATIDVKEFAASLITNDSCRSRSLTAPVCPVRQTFLFLSVSGRVDVFLFCFFLTDVPSGACLLQCSGEACFHLSCLCHTKSEGEEWEITLFPVSVNLGHRASGGNTPGSFSPWVTAGRDLSLSLCHPSSQNPYCSSIIILSARVPSVCIVFLFF